MALVHNMIIRGLNSIYLQAPQVPSTNTASFLSYCSAWHDLLHVHHSGEEADFFPFVEEATGKKGLMDANVEQHHAFQTGVEGFHAYVRDCIRGKENYDGDKVVKMIDGFGETLAKHLADEIPTLLQLREYGEEKLGLMEKMFQDEGEKNMVSSLIPNFDKRPTDPSLPTYRRNSASSPASPFASVTTTSSTKTLNGRAGRRHPRLCTSSPDT